jgi:hypothetical protein
LSHNEKRALNNEINAQTIKDIFNVLDTAILKRKLKEINEILGKQILPDDFEFVMDILDGLYDHRNPSFSKLDIYLYGYIQGKRAERARKKQHGEVAAC